MKLLRLNVIGAIMKESTKQGTHIMGQTSAQRYNSKKDKIFAEVRKLEARKVTCEHNNVNDYFETCDDCGASFTDIKGSIELNVKERMVLLDALAALKDADAEDGDDAEDVDALVYRLQRESL